MFKLISTLLRGKAHDAERAFADQNAIPLLAQQIRDAAQSIQSARRSVAVAIAQNEQEKLQHTKIVARIGDLETRACAALGKGDDGLAREAAEAIAYLETERDQSEKAQAQFVNAIDKLKGTVRLSETRLQELQRGERLARATHEAQKLDVAAADSHFATLDEAEETLGRLWVRQSQAEITASALKAMETSSSPVGIIEKLANAGYGAPLHASADDVLARLRNRIHPAA